MAIGGAGAFNAGLLASQILANQDADLALRIEVFRTEQTQAILDNPDPRKG
jgi:5-(carboxyamino)imidazole ribonucleotide mutase